MTRIGLKNTFLSIEAEEGGEDTYTFRRQYSAPLLGSVTRGRSAEASLGCCSGRPEDADESFQVLHLNHLLSGVASRQEVMANWAADLKGPIWGLKLQRVLSSKSSCSIASEGSDESARAETETCEAVKMKSLASAGSRASTSTVASLPMCSESDSLEPGAAPAKMPEYCHRNVPRKQDLRAKSTAVSQDGAQPTTLMIRNIPNRYCQQDLIDELEGLGLAGTFDFLYLPHDKCSKASVGYAFVNFVASSWAEQCNNLLSGHVFAMRRGKSKEAFVSWAHLQGLEANLAHYNRAAVGTAKIQGHRPMVLAGKSEVLPPPR
mmetsp:Transcript_31707/g.69134  ORF Transcript_31707/g.69134 Transcript_31707/m.69134 type:complete len:320 (-) Transcript_31707:36-995(-)